MPNNQTRIVQVCSHTSHPHCFCTSRLAEKIRKYNAIVLKHPALKDDSVFVLERASVLSKQWSAFGYDHYERAGHLVTFLTAGAYIPLYAPDALKLSGTLLLWLCRTCLCQE